MDRICRVHLSSSSPILRRDLETNYLIEVKNGMVVTSLGRTSTEMDGQRFAMGIKVKIRKTSSSVL